MVIKDSRKTSRPHLTKIGKLFFISSPDGRTAIKKITFFKSKHKKMKDLPSTDNYFLKCKTNQYYFYICRLETGVSMPPACPVTQ